MTNVFESEVLLIILLAAASCNIAGFVSIFRKTSTTVDSAAKSAALGVALGLLSPHIIPAYLFIPLTLFSVLIGIWLSNDYSFSKLSPKNYKTFTVPSAFFALGILMISIFSKLSYPNINILLSGNPVMLSFERVTVVGMDLGPLYIYILVAVFLFNTVCFSLFYKEICVHSFDKTYAKSIQFPASKADSVIIFMIAITVVSTFKVTGILTAAVFFLAPTLIARFFSKHFFQTIIFSNFICITACFIGFRFAKEANIDISGAIASVMGILFMVSIISAPSTGVMTIFMQKLKKHRSIIKDLALANVLLLCKKTPEQKCSVSSFCTHMAWDRKYSKRILTSLKKDMIIYIENDNIALTDEGYKKALKIIKDIDKPSTINETAILHLIYREEKHLLIRR